MPFLDHVLFEKARHIPLEIHLKNGIEKYILRQIARPFITDEIYRRPKFMFQAPSMKLSKTGPYFQMVCDSILSNLDLISMYNKKNLHHFIDQACSIDQSNWLEAFNMSTTLTQVASVALLAKNYAILVRG